MISKYIENFKVNLEECEIFQQMIDHKFQTITKPYIMNQFVFYMITFVIPFFMIEFGNLVEIYLTYCLSTVLFGTTGMFFLEVMEMKVQGVKVYF